MIKYEPDDTSSSTIKKDEDMLNMDLLLQKRREIIRRRHNVYREILKLCHKRITHQANKQPNNTWCVYQIPNWVPCLPRFNVNLCTRFCVAKLRKNGFLVTLTPPQTLYISWEHYEKQLKLKARERKRLPIFRKLNKQKELKKKISFLETLPSYSVKNSIIKRPT